MKRFNQLVFTAALAGAMAVTGCGKGGEGEKNVPAGDRAESQALLATSEVKCPNPEECPTGVGMLATVRDRSVSLCTAFLISKDVVATSGHCLPEELRTPRADCSGKVAVVFPAMGGAEAERRDCAQVLASSPAGEQSGGLRPDYAFLRLARPSSRDPIPVAQEGAADGATFSMVRLAPITADYPLGELRRSQCVAVHGSTVLPQFDSPERPLWLIGDCEVRPGSEGAPLLNEAGQALGIVQAALERDQSNPHHETQRPLGFATSFVCVPPVAGVEGLVLSPAAGCSVDLGPELEAQLNRAAYSKLIDGMDDAAQRTVNEQWQPGVTGPFRWRAGPADNRKATDPVYSPVTRESLFTAYPTCFRDPVGWLQDYKKGRGYREQATITVSPPVWKMAVSLDMYSRYAAEAKADGANTLALEFSPAEFKRVGASWVRISRINGGKRKLLYSERLVACPR